MTTERQGMRGGLRERKRLSLHILLTTYLRFCEHAGASESAASLERRKRRRKQKTDCSFVQQLSCSRCSSSTTQLTRHVSRSFTRSLARSRALTRLRLLSRACAHSLALLLSLSRAHRSLPLALFLSLSLSHSVAPSVWRALYPAYPHESRMRTASVRRPSSTLASQR